MKNLTQGARQSRKAV